MSVFEATPRRILTGASCVRSARRRRLKRHSCYHREGAPVMRIIARDLRPGGKGADLDSATVVQDPGVMEILNLGSLIRQIKVYRADDIQAAHWEIYLASDGPCIKVDLVDAGYRILYG